MSANKPDNGFIAGQHVVQAIPFKAHRLPGLSGRLLESHYENNYGGAVRRLNAIEKCLAEIGRTPALACAINSIKHEALIAANSMILHEVYFDSIGEEGGQALTGELARALERDFGSIARWRDEFSAMANAMAGASGWVLLVWSDRFDRLRIEQALGYTHNLAGAAPILALDMYEHAYHIDFGANAAAYADAFLQNIHWGRVSERYQRVRQGLPKAAAGPSTDQIGVNELQTLLRQSNPLVIDVRHIEDRERSGVRILETIWRDSHCVPDWANALAKDTPVVVYCMYGFWVSQDAAKELRALGYDARYLTGGIAAWRAMDYPTTPLAY